MLSASIYVTKLTDWICWEEMLINKFNCTLSWVYWRMLIQSILDMCTEPMARVHLMRLWENIESLLEALRDTWRNLMVCWAIRNSFVEKDWFGLISHWQIFSKLWIFLNQCYSMTIQTCWLIKREFGHYHNLRIISSHKDGLKDHATTWLENGDDLFVNFKNNSSKIATRSMFCVSCYILKFYWKLSFFC